MTEKIELWDVLDENGNLTGETVERGQPLKVGDYHLVVNIWIRNSKGEYLIQKRADNLEKWPGLWAATGGAVIKGESSLEAALREVKEELGISFEPHMLKKVRRFKLKHALSDMWMVCHDVDLTDVVIQKEEVNEVKYAAVDEIMRMIDKSEFLDYSKDCICLLKEEQCNE